MSPASARPIRVNAAHVIPRKNRRYLQPVRLSSPWLSVRFDLGVEA
jgi:hypothetical protein